MAMLNEAIKRARPGFQPGQQARSDLIEGEVVASPDDDSTQPS
ncbi:hypothetical protein AB0E69_23385 [Kribbella sp. NPDC026611]